MVKVVINRDFGGFGLSKEAIDRYCKEKGIEPGEWSKTVWGFYSNFNERDVLRDDEVLVRIVEEMGEAADDECSKLKVVEIPDDVDWYIEEYDGSEWVAERHRTWR
jgi:hypothetical protein